MINDPGFTIQNVWTQCGHGDYLREFGRELARYETETSMLSIMAFIRHINAEWNDVLNVDQMYDVIEVTDQITDDAWRTLPGQSILDLFVKHGFLEWVDEGVTFRVTQKFVDFCRKHRFEEAQEPIYAKEPVYAPKRWWHALPFLTPKITGHRQTEEITGYKQVFLRVTA